MKNFLLVTAGIVAFSAAAMADELKIHTVSKSTSFNMVPVDDIDGHGLVLTKFGGQATVPDGSTGKINWSSVSDSNVKTTGNVLRFYFSVTTDDGSVLWLTGNGSIKAGEGGKTYFVGPVSISSGTGKYAGAKGEGTWTVTNTRVGTNVEGTGDFILNLKK